VNPDKSYRYRVVDVFTTEPLKGNPLAVFPDATGLRPDLMQKIARELNLSETVFALPPSRPDCVAKLRIYTPGKELDFAGHPTVGTAYILLDESRVTKGTERFLLEENIGPIPIHVDPGPSPKLWLMTPPLREGAIVAPTTAAALLSLKEGQLLAISPQLLDAGNPTLLFRLQIPKPSIASRSTLPPGLSSNWNIPIRSVSSPSLPHLQAPTRECSRRISASRKTQQPAVQPAHCLPT